MQKLHITPQSMFSPDTDTFSTPPTTPTALEPELRPSLSRRSSRPSSLNIQQTAGDQWKPAIILENNSSTSPLPNGTGTSSKSSTPQTATLSSYSATTSGVHHLNGSALSNGSLLSPAPGAHFGTPSVTYSQGGPSVNTQTHLSTSNHSPRPSPHQHLQQQHQLSPSPTAMGGPLTSPCFVHSQLQGASLGDWLKEKSAKATPGYEPHLGGVLGMGHPNGHTGETAYRQDVDSDEEEGAGSLTAQLAETAVGVREMSKQLGRTRVHSAVQAVLIVTKARDNNLIKLTRELALYLMLKPQGKTGRGVIVYVDSQLKTSRRFDAAGIEHEHPELFVPYSRRRTSSSSSLASATTNGSDDNHGKSEGQLRYWTSDMCNRSPHLFDFVVTLGGDGTVLFTSWLFQRIVPPVLPFALGSLGFLTNFDFADHQAVMDAAIATGIRVNLRMRFTCTVYRAVAPEDDTRKRRAIKKGDTGEILMRNLEKGGWEALEAGCFSQGSVGKCKDKEIMCFTTRPVESFEVLNDLVVDRGPSPYVSLLELFGDENHLTTVQADGLTISTPTGSTAYSLSAGGSLVHPEIPAILITPICPHTLSFRPMLLPDSMELRICVPFNSRSTAWASFDGRGRVELKQGDHIKVTASKYPFPTVCAETQSVDWFHSITRTLKWNERERQKSFVVVEEGPSSKKTRSSQRRRSGTIISPSTSPAESKGHHGAEEEDEVSSEEEEDEKFDIDDISSSNESPKSSISSINSADAVQQSNQAEPLDQAVAREKVLEQERNKHLQQIQAEKAARSLALGTPSLSALVAKRRTRSRSRDVPRSGINTPDRFTGPHPHPPKVSPRHVQFLPNPSTSSSAASIHDIITPMERESTIRVGERGTRDDIHSPRAHGGGRSRIPREREREGAGVGDSSDVKTPTLLESAKRRVSRERDGNATSSLDSGSPHVRRAFAVWGQDESDSAASDSDC
ncbi:hypothetical protein C8Q75DRAFT_775300 [Abortiporus biennis]|nr:hypothetical protein C8Q75DRAFT_775300 [Abortiporus biennis]